MGNAYLDKLDEAKMEGVQIGIDIGMQIACDMISLSLRDPAVMKKDTFSAARLAPVMKDALEKRGLYAPAWGGRSRSGLLPGQAGPQPERCLCCRL